MKIILVTGATGFLGQSVVKELLKNEDYYVIAVGGRRDDSICQLPIHPRFTRCLLMDFFTQDFYEVDALINCAFARSNDPEMLAQSLDFTEKLIGRMEELRVRSTINLSSQGVYKRLPVGELSVEESPIAPIDLYSMAKYATERLFTMSTLKHVTNVRLGSLMMPQRFLYFFVQKALRNEAFMVTAPCQYAALMDVNDAAKGLVSIVALPNDKRAITYNLGIGTQYSLLQYAESVKRIGKKFGYEVAFDVAEKGKEVCSGMNCAKLMKDTGWKPEILMDEMISNLFMLGQV